MSTAGSALAVTGIADSGSAGVAQYSEKQTNSQDQGGTLTDNNQGGGGPGGGDRQTMLGEPNSGNAPNSGTGGHQKAVQLSTGGGDPSLPFTGFLAIPVLLGGVALLLTGLGLQRKTVKTA